MSGGLNKKGGGRVQLFGRETVLLGGLLRRNKLLQLVKQVNGRLPVGAKKVVVVAPAIFILLHDGNNVVRQLLGLQRLVQMAHQLVVERLCVGALVAEVKHPEPRVVRREAAEEVVKLLQLDAELGGRVDTDEVRSHLSWRGRRGLISQGRLAINFFLGGKPVQKNIWSFQMIPPILHFIWIDLGSPIPDAYIRNIKMAQRNTDCRIVLHTDAKTQISGVETRHLTVPYSKEELATTVNSGKRVSHYKDSLRLDILHKEGGIYSDLDVIWLKNPWFLLHHRLFIGFDNKAYKILCNAVIGSEAGHPALQIYKTWLESIWPPKKYWIPANPYKIWKDRTDVTFLEKYMFFPLHYKKIKNGVNVEDVERSVAVHLYDSFGNPESGTLIELANRYAKDN